MKILAICGSPRKNNTYGTLDFIQELFPALNYELIHLPDMKILPCKGCYTCVLQGESKCPLVDDRKLIQNKMREADGLILGSPVHSHMSSAILKNFIDRFGFMVHRPAFFGKSAMSVLTCSGYGVKSASSYINKMLELYGYDLVPHLELHFRPGMSTASNLELHRSRLVTAVNTLMVRINSSIPHKPRLRNLVPFYSFKRMSELDPELFHADYQYHKDKDDDYFNVHIDRFQKLMATIIARHRISKL